MAKEKHVVASVSEIPVGGRKLVDVKGRKIVLFNLSGEFFAISDKCPHQGGSLSQGRRTGIVAASSPTRRPCNACASMCRRGPPVSTVIDVRGPRKIDSTTLPDQLISAPFAA